jgi:hypothetical protein
MATAASAISASVTIAKVDDVPPVPSYGVVLSAGHIAGREIHARGLREIGGEQGGLEPLREPLGAFPGPDLLAAPARLVTSSSSSELESP